MELIDEITLDDVASPDAVLVNSATPAPCWEVEIKEKNVTTAFHITSSPADGQNNSGKYENIPAGQPKKWTAQLSSRHGGMFRPNDILGYAETLTGAGARTFTRICRY